LRRELLRFTPLFDQLAPGFTEGNEDNEGTWHDARVLLWDHWMPPKGELQVEDPTRFAIGPSSLSSLPSVLLLF
jgi:hypothetical protein